MSKLQYFCPACNKILKLPSSSKFCYLCGTSLESPPKIELYKLFDFSSDNLSLSFYIDTSKIYRFYSYKNNNETWECIYRNIQQLAYDPISYNLHEDNEKNIQFENALIIINSTFRISLILDETRIFDNDVRIGLLSSVYKIAEKLAKNITIKQDGDIFELMNDLNSIPEEMKLLLKLNK